MPNPPIDGGAQVMHFTTQGLLANGINVKILAINPTRQLVCLDILPTDYLAETRFECVTVDTTIKPWRFITNVFRSESYFTERFISNDLETKIKNILDAECFDIIQLEHVYLCQYIHTIKKYSKAKILLRPQNVEYIIWERYSKNIKNPFKKAILGLATERLKRYEQSVIKDLDGIIALTREDADIISSFCANTPIIIVPMGYDYKNLKNYDFNRQFDSEPIIYHLGSMDWLPNVEAVQWFIKFVIPYLEKQQFSAKIIIAGRKMPASFFDYNSDILEIRGEINNPLEFQEDKQIMIVPLWSGSGIRAKIIEGLALGKTIISTSIGAQGIGYEDGLNLLIADTPTQFGDQIMKCVRSKELCTYISKNARLLSAENYHYHKAAKKMIAFYQEILNSNA